MGKASRLGRGNAWRSARVTALNITSGESAKSRHEEKVRIQYKNTIGRLCKILWHHLLFECISNTFWSFPPSINTFGDAMNLYLDLLILYRQMTILNRVTDIYRLHSNKALLYLCNNKLYKFNYLLLEKELTWHNLYSIFIINRLHCISP